MRQSDIGARILEIRGHRSQAAFAEMTGVSVKTLGRYESGERPPDLAFLTLVRQKMGISSDWIISGEGKRQAAHGTEDEPADYGDFSMVPLYDVHASAGAGALVVSEKVLDTLAFRADFLRHELNAGRDDLYLIHVEGDSMEPTLRGGDVILVDHRRKVPDREGIYVIRMGDALLVKRLQLQPGGLIMATSDNAAYKTFELPLNGSDSGVAVIGRVVWAGRRF